jgi:hypothetical protein
LPAWKIPRPECGRIGTHQKATVRKQFTAQRRIEEENFMALSVVISNRKDKVGSEVSVPVSVQGGQSGVGYTYAAAGLPPGLHINPRTGVIQGTANAPGTYSVDVTATDDAAPPNSATSRITWNIFKSSADLAAVADQTHYVGEHVDLQINASGGSFSFSATGLPPGLSITRIDATAAVISGTATDPVPAQTVTITATDASTGDPPVTQTFLWTVLAAEVVLDTIPDQQHLEGQDVHLAVRSHSPDVTYRATGLPPGLSMDADTGVISGTASTAGSYDVTVTATSKRNRRLTDSKAFTWIVEETLDVTDKWFKLEVPDYENSSDLKRSYLRMGAPDTPYEESFLPQKAAYSKPGWLEYTDGDRVIETQGNVYFKTHGVECRQNDDDMFEFKWGLDYQLGLGLKFEAFAGLAGQVLLGGKFESNATPLPSVTMNTGFEIQYGASAKYEATQDRDITLSGNIVQEATESIQLSVDPDDTKWEKFHEQYVPIIAAAGAAVTGVAGAVATGIGKATENTSWSGVGKGAAITAQGIAGLLYTLGVLNALVDCTRRKMRSQRDEPASKLEMDKERIEIKVGASSIVLTKEEIILQSSKIVLMQSGTASATLDDDAFTVCFRDIKVKGAEITVPDGAVSAKKLAASDGIFGDMGDLGKPGIVNPVNEPAYMKKLRREMAKRRHAMSGGND